MPVWYQEMGTVQASDIATIDCVVGQVKVGNRWGIIDQSFGSQCVAMHGMWAPEYESEDGMIEIYLFYILLCCPAAIT